MPACAACSAPDADWLTETSEDMAVELVENVADDAGLHLQAILERADGVLPARLGGGEQRSVGPCGRRAP